MLIIGTINYLKNEQVVFKQIMLIAEDGTRLGVMSAKDGYFKARSRGLDLVCIAPDNEIPVCKIMDYDKFRYQQSKKEKENKKKQVSNEVGEVQLSLTIQLNDMKTKANTVKRLIERGQQVRIVMRLRGREVSLTEMATTKVRQFIELCSEFTQVKKDIFTEGRDIKCILEKKKGEK